MSAGVCVDVGVGLCASVCVCASVRLCAGERACAHVCVCVRVCVCPRYTVLVTGLSFTQSITLHTPIHVQAATAEDTLQKHRVRIKLRANLQNILGDVRSV